MATPIGHYFLRRPLLFRQENRHFVNLSYREDVFFSLSPLQFPTMMHVLKGKELIRRLSWLVLQDEENFKLQLKDAVSVFLFLEYIPGYR